MKLDNPDILQNLPNVVLYQQNNQNLGDTCRNPRGIIKIISISHSSSYFDGSILNNMEYFRGLFCLAFYSDFFGFVQDRGIFKIISTSHSSSYFDRWILNNMEYFRGLFCLQNNQKI